MATRTFKDVYGNEKTVEEPWGANAVKFDIPGVGGGVLDEETGVIYRDDASTGFQKMAYTKDPNPSANLGVGWYNSGPMAQSALSGLDAYRAKQANPNATVTLTDPTGSTYTLAPDGTQKTTAYTPTIYLTDQQQGSKAIFDAAAPDGTIRTTPIGNPVQAPSQAASLPGPTFSTPTGSAAANSYNTGLATALESAKAALQAEADKRVAEYDTKIKALEQKELEYQQLQDNGMLGLKDTTFAEVAEKRAALDLEKQRFDENYNANQALIGELETLLTQGNEIIEGMKGTTGLASIMNPRIAQTMSDVAARAGIIQAVISARNGQMSQAQSQLNTTINALESIYGDQIAYYKDVVNYYGTLKNETNDKILNLTKDQKAYADVKINMLENELNQIQETSNMVRNAMLDPETALMYAKAGITLKDSVETINQKLATYQYSQEVSNISNTMVDKGYSKSPIAGGEAVEIIDSMGTKHVFYRKPDATEDGAFTLGTNQVRFDAAGNVIAEGPKPEEKAAENELNELLSPSEAKALGVPYGTTKGQASKTIAPPSPSGYPMTELQKGSTNTAEVKKLQDYLVSQGLMTQADFGADGSGYGVYGPKTEAAVGALQDKIGVDYSGGGKGQYGPRTIAALQGKAYVPPPKTTSSSSSSGTWGTLTPSVQTSITQYIAQNSNDPQGDLAKAKSDPGFLMFLLGQVQ